MSWINIIKKSPTNFLYDYGGLLIPVASIVLIAVAILTILKDMVEVIPFYLKSFVFWILHEAPLLISIPFNISKICKNIIGTP